MDTKTVQTQYIYLDSSSATAKKIAKVAALLKKLNLQIHADGYGNFLGFRYLDIDGSSLITPFNTVYEGEFPYKVDTELEFYYYNPKWEEYKKQLELDRIAKEKEDIRIKKEQADLKLLAELKAKYEK